LGPVAPVRVPTNSMMRPFWRDVENNALTQEFLAEMLGARRTSATLAVSALQRSDLDPLRARPYPMA